MIVWYNNKRYALSDEATITPDSMCHLVSTDDTVPEYKVVRCSKIEFTEPPPSYWDMRDAHARARADHEAFDAGR